MECEDGGTIPLGEGLRGVLDPPQKKMTFFRLK